MMRTPDAGTCAGAVIFSTRSGVPIFHPSANTGEGGRSFRSPSGAPPSAHATIVATSFADRLGSLTNSPYCGSAPQGGIMRSVTAFLIDRAHGRAASYVVSDIGAISPGRWHDTQFLLRIGATSFVNVTDARAAAGACAPGIACQDNSATTPTPPTARVTRTMTAPLERTSSWNPPSAGF